MDALLKTLKRTMAAEYSRELSVKVFEGQRRIAELGYRLGGSAGFGFRRMVFDPSGSRKTVLEAGEHKTIHTDRVTLVHGPIQEVRVVRKVFDLFVNHDLSEARIATYLTERGIRTRLGNPWRKKSISDMLTNPKYAGDMVFNRTAAKFRSAPVKTPPEKWVCVPDHCCPRRFEGEDGSGVERVRRASDPGRVGSASDHTGKDYPPMGRVCSIFSQILRFIPRSIFESAVQEHQTEKHAKGMTSWSQFIALLFCHLGGALSLREIVGGLAASEGKLKHLGLDRAPTRSTLAYANEHRPWQLYKSMFDRLAVCRDEAKEKKRKFRFKHPLLTLDATVIPVCVSMFEWASYVKTKGAVKLHMVLDTQLC